MCSKLGKRSNHISVPVPVLSSNAYLRMLPRNKPWFCFISTPLSPGSQGSMVHYFYWVHKLRKVHLVQGSTTSQGLQCLTVSQLQQFRTFQSIHMSKDFLVVFKPKFQEQQEWHSIVSLADSSCLRSPT